MTRQRAGPATTGPALAADRQTSPGGDPPLDLRLGVFALAVWAATLVALWRGRGAAAVLVVAGLLTAGLVTVGFVLRLRRPAGSTAAAGRIVAVIGLGVAAGAGCCGLALGPRDGGPVHDLPALRLRWAGP